MWSRAGSIIIALCASVTVVMGGGPAAADGTNDGTLFVCNPVASAYVTAPGADSVTVYAAGDTGPICRLLQVSISVTDVTSSQSLYSGSMDAPVIFNSAFTVPRGHTVSIDVRQHDTTAMANATVLPVAPSTVTSLVASAATQTTMQLDWVAPSGDGGSPITGYAVSWAGGTTQASTTEVVVSGLSPGTTYTFAVTAQNAVGASDATTVTASTTAKPVPPSPAPAPNPQPSGITPTTVATPGAGNLDGSVDTDSTPRTIQQTVKGTWPKRSSLTSGKQVTFGRLAALRTNAGQQAVMSVTYLSPSIRSASISIDGRGRVVGVTAILKKGTKSGAVVLTVNAAPTSAGDVGYEGIQASRRYAVRPA